MSRCSHHSSLPDPFAMSTVAEKAYHNEPVARTVLEHLDKPSIRSIMMAKQEGDMFDSGVRALYKEVNYDVILDMDRTTVGPASVLMGSSWLDTDHGAGAIYQVPRRRTGGRCKHAIR